MPKDPMSRVIEHLRTAALLRDGAGLGDGELLGLFVERHDQAALAALVRRHGPMVWGTCRRLLGHHDAEDAFQATFLVLVKKAASIAPREMVGNWLYGVAHQTALQARRAAARRRTREVQVAVMPEPEAAQQDRGPADVQPLLDQELSRLPDVYRAVVVLCDLEGRTRKEVARLLGVPEGTVAGRLARARALLAKRLSGRGVTSPSGVAVAAVPAPESVVSGAIKAVASSFAAGQTAAAAATGPVSATAAALAEGVLKAMLMGKLAAVAVAVVVVLGLVIAGGTALTGGTTAAMARAPAPQGAKVQKEKGAEKDRSVAWGKEVGGLQAGLALPPGAKRAYRQGDTVTLLVRVRNVGKQPVKFAYVMQFLDEEPPAVTGADGKAIEQHRVAVLGFHVPKEVTLEPGKEVVLESRFSGADGRAYALLPVGGGGGGKRLTEAYPLLVGTGKVGLRYDRVFGNSSAGAAEVDPALARLATGTLELEVGPAADEKK